MFRMNKRWLNIVIALMLVLSIALPISPVSADELSGANTTDVSVTVDIRVEGYKGTVLKINDFVATGDSTISAADVTRQALDTNEIPYVYLEDSGYFKSINGESDSELSIASGWLYKINEVYPDEYADAIDVNNGDEIVWHYTNFSDVIENLEYPGMTIGSGVDTVDKVTFEPIIDMPTTAVAGEPLTIKVTGNYNILNLFFETLQSNLTTDIDQVTIEMNGKQYLTDENGEVTIPAEDIVAGDYELRFTKDLPGRLLSYTDIKNIDSYPRIIRTYKQISITDPVDPSTIYREKVEQALVKGKSYLLSAQNLSTINSRVNGSHSGYWMLSAMYAAGVDINNYPWDIAPTSTDPETYWTKPLTAALGDSNQAAGVIIGATLLGLDPTNVKSLNIVDDLIAKQKAAGNFYTIWGESWAMIALDLVDAQYNQTAHINSILSAQNKTTGYFGDLDATGWILMALASHRDQPDVEEAIQKAVAGYHKVFIEKGFTDNSNSMACIISGLASVGEDLFSDKWTYEKDGQSINIVSYLAEKYQLDDGGIRYQAKNTSSNIMALEQVYIAFSDALTQKSTFVRLKESFNNETPGGETPGEEIPGVETPGGENPGGGTTNPGNGSNPGETNPQTITAYVSIKNDTTNLLNKYAVTVSVGDNAYDALVKAAQANEISVQASMTSMGMYVEGINGLKEFDRGPKSGWMYKVNGVFPEYSADNYTLQSGDQIQWLYTKDLGIDIGGGSDGIVPTEEENVPATDNNAVVKLELTSDVLKKQLQDQTTKQIVIEDKTGIKIDLPKSAFATDIEKVNVSVQQKNNTVSIQIEVTHTDGKVTSLTTSKEYIKVTLPATDVKKDTVLLTLIDGKYYAVPHKIINNQIIIYMKTSNEFVISMDKVLFKDLEGIKHREDIEFLAARHVINGKDAENFKPHAEITRAEFASLVSRALGLKSEGVSSFNDTQGKWYEQDVQALFEAGITTGISDTSFNPNGAITREQAAAIMARVLTYLNYEVTETSTPSYVDADAISKGFKEAIDLLYSLNIMTGKADGKFDPTGNITREQTAKILKGILNVVDFM